MKRKLRNLVVFPIEGLDLSPIVAASDHQEISKEINGGNSKPTSRASFHNDSGRDESLYDLYAVVHHQGALSGGHYVASLRSEIDGKWRLFNDAQVYDLNPREVVDATAYILFYIRRDVKNVHLADFWDMKSRDGQGVTEEQIDKLVKQRERCVVS